MLVCQFTSNSMLDNAEDVSSVTELFCLFPPEFALTTKFHLEKGKKSSDNDAETALKRETRLHSSSPAGKMHLLSCIIVVITLKSCSCDVLVYTQATNQVKFEAISTLKTRQGQQNFNDEIIIL